MISRRLTGEPWYYDILRTVIAQHIEDNSNRYKDFIVGNIKDNLLKISRNGVGWKLWNSSIQQNLQCKR